MAPLSLVTLPGTSHPLDPTAVVALLTSRTREFVRRLQPTVRGRGVTQSWRIKDAKRRPTINDLLGVIADAVCDTRVPTSALVDLLHGLELEIRVLRGESADVPALDAAHVQEMEAQGPADVAQLQALLVRGPAALLDSITAMQRHRTALDRAILATRAEYDRMTRPTLAS